MNGLPSRPMNGSRVAGSSVARALSGSGHTLMHPETDMLRAVWLAAAAGNE